MGEQKEEKTEEKKEKKGGGEKKEDGPVPVVIKVDMHCEGCARKVKKSVKDLPGVQDVKADLIANKLTVIGKVDPKTVCERVQKRCQKKIELISPLPKKEEGEKKEQKPEEKEKEKKPEEKKEKEPTVITTVLKVNLHCEACAHNVKKAILKFPGVQTAESDLKNNTFSVKGTMDPNKLAVYLNKKTKKHVEVVPQKKEGEKKEDKKEDKKEGNGGGKKKDGGGDKKDEENKKKGEDDKKADESKGDSEEAKGEGKKNEAPIPRYVIEHESLANLSDHMILRL
ncbi:hypothetical protein SUGI_0856180 [Cryptomeria japonica]|nr:hypothetical protein SUGI_0856180 [Cryptomeria japonica]